MKKIIAMAFAAAALAACGGSPKTAQTAAAPAEVVPGVRVIKAESRAIPQTQTYSATVQANIVNNIAPQAGSRICKINAEVGDFVKKGEILAEMDRMSLDQAELQLSNSETEFKRIESLYKKGGVSQSDYESAELALKVNKSKYENLLTNTILRSPVEGVVSARNYDQGDMYNMSQPLYVVQQISPVKIIVAISEKDYTKVSKGDKVRIVADALPGKTFTGEIVRKYPTVDAATHTVSVEVQVPNKDKELRPGMYVNSTVTFTVENLVVIPDSAVLKQQGSGQRIVYVLNPDGTVTLKVVEVGRHIGSEFEILSGIEAGETVVTRGQSALRSGIKVEVLE